MSAELDMPGGSGRENKPTCLLVDGHGLIYRAFFALPVMTTRDGRHTHALFGFIRMMRQLWRCWEPSHLAVAFDAGLPERRKQLLESYKAQRPPMPAALREQIDYVWEYLDAALIPVVRFAGEEADDVIASLVAGLAGERSCVQTPSARKDDQSGEVLMASIDKDLYQLVSDHVAMVSVSGKPLRTGVDEVIAKTGVAPGRIVDWLALTGDSADNIPGAPGIGPKTAARLLNEYGNLETILRHLDSLGSKTVRETLSHNRDLLIRNIELMTLRRDLPVQPRSWDELVCRKPDRAVLEEFAARYEFKSAPAARPDAPSRETQGVLGL